MLSERATASEFMDAHGPTVFDEGTGALAPAQPVEPQLAGVLAEAREAVWARKSKLPGIPP